MTSSSSFAGEKFLQVDIPNYEREYWKCIALFTIVGVFYIISLTLPWVLSKKYTYEITKRLVSDGKDSNDKGETTIYTVRKVPFYSRILSLVGILMSVFGAYFIILNSPNNTFTPRRVFEAPILTEEECAKIIQISHEAAERNIARALREVEKLEESEQEQEEEEYDEEEEERESHLLLREPKGWQKLRHGSYPTTDLNLVTDPYTPEDRQWVKGLLDRRLAPTLSRIYGIPPRAMRAHDLFVVRYDADSRNSLTKHMDGGDISINILLNNEFEGGGTRFWSRKTKQPFDLVKPQRVGNLLTHTALLDHEGFPIDSGTRYILVMFMDVDRIVDGGENGQHTGISPFASFLSFNWSFVRVHAFYTEWADWLNTNLSAKSRRWVLKYLKHLRSYMDEFAVHKVEKLVQEKDSLAFINALDESFDEKTMEKARWCQAQELNAFLNLLNGAYSTEL